MALLAPASKIDKCGEWNREKMWQIYDRSRITHIVYRIKLIASECSRAGKNKEEWEFIKFFVPTARKKRGSNINNENVLLIS